MKSPGVDEVRGDTRRWGTVNGEETFISSRGRRIAGAQGRGNQAVSIAQTGDRNSEPDRIGGPAIYHAFAIKRVHPDAVERGDVTKHVRCQEKGALRCASTRVPHC